MCVCGGAKRLSMRVCVLYLCLVNTLMVSVECVCVCLVPSVERHIGGLCVCIPLAIAAIETVGAFQLTVLSVEPGDWHPLWCGVHPLNGRLQRGNRLANIVVHNGQVKEVPIQLTQHIRFFGQTLQAAIVLKRNQFPKTS